MTHFRLTPEAEGDLDEIKRYLVQQGGTRLARYVLAELRRALRFLGQTPEAGHKREDLTGDAVKFWSVFAYMIVYDPHGRPVTIVRILHGGRDLKGLFRRSPPRA